MLPYVVIASYVRTDGWLIIRLEKITGDCVVIKRGIFSLFLSGLSSYVNPDIAHLIPR